MNRILILLILVSMFGGVSAYYFFSRDTVPNLNEGTTGVQVFFNNDRLDPEFSCNKVFPVQRMVERTPAVARAALQELLKGPLQGEKEQGFFTSLNMDVQIQNLVIENSVAKIDFNEQLQFQVGGSCRVSAIRAQITETLKQFSTVDSVVISIDGRIEDILQP
jgi:spore germination protein GerM